MTENENEGLLREIRDLLATQNSLLEKVMQQNEQGLRALEQSGEEAKQAAIDHEHKTEKYLKKTNWAVWGWVLVLFLLLALFNGFFAK